MGSVGSTNGGDIGKVKGPGILSWSHGTQTYSQADSDQYGANFVHDPYKQPFLRLLVFVSALIVQYLRIFFVENAERAHSDFSCCPGIHFKVDIKTTRGTVRK